MRQLAPSRPIEGVPTVRISGRRALRSMSDAVRGEVSCMSFDGSHWS
jgi:hypothetical protein